MVPRAPTAQIGRIHTQRIGNLVQGDGLGKVPLNIISRALHKNAGIFLMQRRIGSRLHSYRLSVLRAFRASFSCEFVENCVQLRILKRFEQIVRNTRTYGRASIST